jgi:tetratricopeptide (TPR) repeat protein
VADAMQRHPRRKPRLIILSTALCLLALGAAGPAPPDGSRPPTPTVEQAIALYDSGRIAEAKRAFDTILVDHPEDQRSLYYAATINSVGGHPEIAIQQVLLLLKATGESLPALELEVQVYQALGETGRRDAAIDRLRTDRESALHLDPHFSVSFIRDRFVIGGRTFIGSENFDRNGETIVRYVFVEAAAAAHPAHEIVLLSDPATNERWHEAASLPPNEVVYHLDTVDRGPDGNTSERSFANYIGEPPYDTVRVAVMAILSGKAKPTTGDADPYWLARPASP